MLKKGLVWHYKAYDRRPELDKVYFILLNFSFVPLFCLVREFMCFNYNGFGNVWLKYVVGERGTCKTDGFMGKSKP